MSAMDLPGYGRTSGGDEGGTSKRPRDLPRKATAVGLAGEVGASFTVYEKNWHCAECEAENTARRPKCWRCRAAKPEGGGGLVNEPAIEAAMVGREGTAWREAFDPATQHLYYYNGATQETSWERPAEMGPAPMATGWFGRGAVAAKALEYQAKIDGWLKRPAPKQKDKVEVDRGYTEGANEYNIWYGRHVGDNWRGEKLGKGDVSDTRCCVQVDAGKTRCTGDVFCIQFARGRCARGHECSYRHTIPSILDDATLPTMKDVFGRDRHATDKEDMGGAGNFMTNSRTVYVGGLRAAAAGEEARALESALWAQFGEWGEVENINVIHRLSIAFVRYRLRASTEFALVAMMNQGLLPTPAEAEGGGGGTGGTSWAKSLNCRWAHDDPNPAAIAANKRANEDAMAAILRAKGISTAEAGFAYPASYDLPPAKRLRAAADAGEPGAAAHAAEAEAAAGADAGGGGGGGSSSGGAAAFPDTDGQYGEAGGAMIGPAGDAAAAYEAYYGQQQQQQQQQQLGASVSGAVGGEPAAAAAVAAAGGEGGGAGAAAAADAPADELCASATHASVLDSVLDRIGHD